MSDRIHSNNSLENGYQISSKANQTLRIVYIKQHIEIFGMTGENC